MAWMYWDPDSTCCRLPFIGWDIKWYGVLFALGFFITYKLCESYFFSRLYPTKKEAKAGCDTLFTYVLLGTLVGARLGHFLFYEPFARLLDDPLQLLRIREGGLASHGAFIGVIGALYFAAKKCNKPFLAIADALAAPAAFVGCCIRLGNFINQEIVGRPTDLPWAVVFGHPVDAGPVVPRHPVQLYEALFYFLVALALSFIFRKAPKQGLIAGLFFVSVFSFRFAIEFVKEPQGPFDATHALMMGQLLSLPIICCGLLLLFRKRKEGEHAL